MAMELKRLSIIVKGRVQGVGFRYFTQDLARSLDLSGWARNLYDGSVELEVQGDASQLDLFIKDVREGPPLSHVSDFQTTEIPLEINERDFIIKH